MATYCRLIKENERLHSKVQSFNVNTSESDETAVRMMELRLNNCAVQISDLKDSLLKYEKQMINLDRKKQELEVKMASSEECQYLLQNECDRYKDLSNSFKREKEESSKILSELTKELLQLRNLSVKNTDLEKRISVIIDCLAYRT